MHRFNRVHLVYVLLPLMLLGGCLPGTTADPGSPTTSVRVTPRATEDVSGAAATPVGQVALTQAPIAQEQTSPTPTTVPVVSPTNAPKPARGTIGVEAAPGLPPAAANHVMLALSTAGSPTSMVNAEADLRLSATSSPGAVLAWEHVLTPADRMSSVLGSISLDELRGVWNGSAASPNFSSIYIAQDLLTEVEALLGRAGDTVKPTAAEEVAGAVWGDKMGLAILPFDTLDVSMRAIPLNGATPVDNRFVAADWPLTLRAWLTPLTARGTAALAKGQTGLPVTNRDPKQLTVLIMTGVTAMARNSAVAIERANDYGFLARQVGPELAAADITIISNEIPFVEDCVADNSLNNLILCSKPEYFENLALSGVDAVGLTGNHQNDFGVENMRASLAFYAGKKLPIYGGGADEKAARAPIVIEHNGNRLGFLGANQWGPESYWSGTSENVSAWAGPDYPGSARFELPTMVADISALKPQVDLVFAEVQHTEFNDQGDYQTEPIPSQETDFRAMSDAGAAVVTGVMAHAPQAVELRDGRLILYGLGNLYFDQTWSWPTRTGLVARHTIYDGKVINTELLVTVIETNFQLRWATPEERAQVLRSVFDVSRW